MLRLKVFVYRILQKIFYLKCYFFSWKPSVYFFTFHKCASSLFGQYVLQETKGLYHVNYASILWKKPMDYNAEFSFRKFGFIYGPLRISARGKMQKALLMDRVATEKFVSDKVAIFVLRDPRDMLVSQYYSFGFAHAKSPDPIKAENLVKSKLEIQKKTIDEYVLEYLPHRVNDFERTAKLIEASKTCVVLKFEDLVNNYDYFLNELKRIIPVSDKMANILFENSRPRKTVDSNAHRRSGKTRSFEKELTQETIAKLNAGFSDVLKHFDYEI